MEEKMSGFDLLNVKITAVRNLIYRNFMNRTPKSIRFPFFIIEPSDRPDTLLEVKMQSDFIKMLVTSNNQLKIYGDIEVLVEIPSVFEEQIENSKEHFEVRKKSTNLSFASLCALIKGFGYNS